MAIYKLALILAALARASAFGCKLTLILAAAARGSAFGTVVPVNVWPHNYSDVVDVATALEAAGRSTTCLCDMPRMGSVGLNGYSCSDGTRGYCSSDEECFASHAFAKGDWQSGCRLCQGGAIVPGGRATGSCHPAL